MPKISQLPPEENPTPDDEFVMVDKALGITKKITGDNISGAFGDESIGIEKIKNLSNTLNPDGSLKGEWQSWTPTLTQITASSTNCEYLDLGSFCIINAEIVVDSVGGNYMAITLPFRPKTYIDGRDLVTGITFYDISAGAAGVYAGTGALTGTESNWIIRFQVPRGTSSVASSSATAPFTWESGDRIIINATLPKYR